MFDGRIKEDFKLSTGTWVSVGPLRARVVTHFAPYIRDAVIAGHDRDDVGLLLVPDVDACRTLAPDLPADAPAHLVVGHAAVRRCVRERLRDVGRGRDRQRHASIGARSCSRRRHRSMPAR